LSAPRILVVGEINADLVLRDLSSFPTLGSEVLASRAELVLGSASAICASGLAKLGNGVRFCGRVGDDLFGRFCLEEMARAGIELEPVLVDPKTATGITVSISAGADRALVTRLGAIAELTAEDVPEAAFEGVAHLHVSGFFLQTGLRPGLPRLFHEARRRGITTSLDCGHDPAGSWDGGLGKTLAETDLFFPNEDEIRAITGRERIEDALSAFESVRVVVKRGATGAACLENGSVREVPAPAADVVDTTGAGDSFVAGFLHAWLRKHSIEKCLEYGVCAGTLSTRALGGTGAQPGAAELESYRISRFRGAH
jgi:sugar/nucleoside kinase (ribokinase family)